MQSTRRKPDVRTLIALLPWALGTLNIAAQGDIGQTTKMPVFEVASVRHNTSGDALAWARWFPGRFTAVNYRLDMLVLDAFGIHVGRAPILLDGGFRFEAKCLRNCSSREEILSARFDVQATFPGEVPPAQQPMVLRGFLEDRFKVKARLETRDRPAYVLTVAREGQLGPRLRPSSHDCGVYAKAETEARRGGAIPHGPVDAAGNPWCGNSNLTKDSVRTRKSAGPFTMLVNSIRVDLPFQLIDRTGLTGNFEWEMTSMTLGWADRVPRQTAPTLDVALREQLGLRLERSTAPLEMLVIDSVAMPSPN